MPGFARKLLAFAGPGYLVAVGYMDPGNWATDIAGGSRFGYALLPVILLSGFAAMFLQWLSLRLGIASGRDLAQACRERFPAPVSRLLWVTCEIAITACDLAEVIGAAIALKLLFGLPLVAGVAMTALDTLLILMLQRRGMRYIEAFVIALMAVIGACFAYEMVCCRPGFWVVASGLIPPARMLRDPSALYISLGIFGATVMPHNLYLHSSISRDRSALLSMHGKKDAVRFSTIDCLAALTVALLINGAILILAGSAFHRAGHAAVEDIQDAYRLLSPTFGAPLAATLFAVALLAAGQNSTLTGTMAGQVVMEGFLTLKMSPALRRLLTRCLAILPALVATELAGEHGAAQLLVFSQVVLSLQLGFAVVPLMMFTSDRRLMGAFVNGPLTRVTGYGLAALIVVVNLWLVLQALHG
ncbi:Nramp family divalent metal transporter [Caulobacter sp. S45]|uniref:Nramp family divalent metal transporter n=1 Tax=Caulobacter sp. S45 TaxID=1641861 RepID=UPI001C2D0CC0|nr:Nramp family divalent metal transporter [Caulobacter sp. S45]